MSKKTKNPQFEPILIHSRDGLQATVSNWTDAKLEAHGINVDMEKEIAAIKAKHQPRLDELARKILATEAAIHVYLKQNPQELGDKKSIDFTQATVGFRVGTPKLEKTRSKDTWADICARLQQTVITSGDVVTFDGEAYVRYGDAEVDKKQLIADRKLIPQEVWNLIAARVDQEEFFYIDPKSEILNPVSSASQEAA